MTKITMAFIFLLFSFYAFADTQSCQLSLPARILVSKDFNANVDFHSFAKASNCQEKNLQKLGEFLISIKGNISSQRLAENFKEAVTISPAQVEVMHIEDVLKQKLDLRKEHFLENIRLVNTYSILTLSENERISADCSNCHNNGLKNIQIEIKDSQKNSSRQLWIQASLMSLARAYVAADNLRVNQKPLSSNDFIKKDILTLNPNQLVSDDKQIGFYRINRALPKGEALTEAHLSPIRLVNQGTPASISLENSSLQLQGSAIPMNGGHYGETVRLRNPNSNRIITGRVVDFNKVVISL